MTAVPASLCRRRLVDLPDRPTLPLLAEQDGDLKQTGRVAYRASGMTQVAVVQHPTAPCNTHPARKRSTVAVLDSVAPSVVSLLQKRTDGRRIL